MSPKKTLVLGTLLLVPVLAFLFLKMFGVNKFSLQTYFPVSVDSTLVAGQWRYDTVYHQVPDFQFTSQTGANFSKEDVAGKVYVAHFFYAACQGNCKQVSTQLLRVQDAFRLQPNVKIVSFSVKPTQDSVRVLNQYAQSFRAKPEKWVFLTGPHGQMKQHIENAFLTSSTSAASDTSFASLLQRLYLVDEKKHIRGMYDGADAAEIDRLITEINVLLSEDKNDNGKNNQR